ncbi:exodeoxyribonuclease VII large subunit [bacterium]|nr:exodeoxyribonuclease VII large subunit [bacterium]
MTMQVNAYSISQITALIRERLEEQFFEVWVKGEVSDLKMPSSGHAYFILKDSAAQLRCVLFKGNQRFIRFQPENGMMVVARGNITVYDRRGEYQFVCDYIEPLGFGSLQIAFDQLKTRLAKEGLFDAGRKRLIPSWPKRIGIVTSPTGAAIRDILNVLTRRFASVQVLINPVRVQGEGAGKEIADAIKELEDQHDIEVIIVARGGGSIEDLWAFNEEVVARAIYSCRVPVISAVGHEIDYTISDFVADLRAPTPSAAAELVIQNREQLEEHLRVLHKGLMKAIIHRIDMDRTNLMHFAGSRTFRNFWSVILQRQEHIDDYEIRLCRSFLQYIGRLKEKIEHGERLLSGSHPAKKIKGLQSQLDTQKSRLEDIMCGGTQERRQALSACMAQIDSLSPLNVLKRGYSLCWRLPDEKLVRRWTDLNVGGLVRLRFHEGGAICEVKGKAKQI